MTPPVTTAALGLPGQQIESQAGQPLRPALIASTNIFLKGDKFWILLSLLHFK